MITTYPAPRVDMELVHRRDQFSYFLGFVSKSKESLLSEAIQMHANAGYEIPSPPQVFQYCPFNDNSAQIIRSFRTFESGKKQDLFKNLNVLLGEFLFLISDFEPPCWGDGRTFYELTASEDIVLTCDRCGTVYSHAGVSMQVDSRKRMAKLQFVELFGEETAEEWPYREKIRAKLLESTLKSNRL